MSNFDFDRYEGKPGTNDDLDKMRDLARRVGDAVRGRLTFFVPGDPQAKGDHTILGAKTGRPWLQERNAGPKAAWRAHAADLAHAALGGRPLLDCAVRVRLEVLRVRPKGHFGSGRNAGVLKASAPWLPTSAPDLDKLQRSLGDALNGVLWRDDALISTWIVTRRWASEAGIRVTVEPDDGELFVVAMSGVVEEAEAPA